MMPFSTIEKHDCNSIVIKIKLFLMQNLELCILPSAGLAKQIVNKPRRTHVVIFIVTINTKDFIWIIMISMSFNEIYFFVLSLLSHSNPLLMSFTRQRIKSRSIIYSLHGMHIKIWMLNSSYSFTFYNLNWRFGGFAISLLQQLVYQIILNR